MESTKELWDGSWTEEGDVYSDETLFKDSGEPLGAQSGRRGGVLC